MRTLIVKLTLLALLAFAFAACQRENTAEEETRATTTTEDVSQSESTIDATTEAIDELINGDNKTAGCATVTASGTTFPITITIDFGTTGCVGLDGRTRKGSVTAVLSDSMRKAGSVRTITFSNYQVSNVSGTQFVTIAGTHTLTNNGLVNGNPSFTATMTNGNLTFPDGTTRTWNATRTRTQTAGYGTATRADDVFSWTGTATGTNRYGIAYTATITTALEKAVACAWIGKGVVEVTSGTRTRTIDYGTGTCDDQAVVTLPDGTTKTVQLR